MHGVVQQLVKEKNIEDLIQMLESGGRDEAEGAARALVERGEEAVKPILKFLDSKNAFIRTTAVEILGENRSDQAVEGLLEFLGDTDYWVRKTAARALGNIGSARAVPGLAVALKDEHHLVREAACRALGEISDLQAVDFLLETLDDIVYTVRGNAARALGNIGDKKAINKLIPCLHDKEVYVRRSTACALGKIKDAAAIPALLDKVKDENPEVRRAVAQALGKIEGENTDALEYLANDEDRSVRKAAMGALKSLEEKDKNGSATPVPTFKDNEKTETEWDPSVDIDELIPTEIEFPLAELTEQERNTRKPMQSKGQLPEFPDDVEYDSEDIEILEEFPTRDEIASIISEVESVERMTRKKEATTKEEFGTDKKNKASSITKSRHVHSKEWQLTPIEGSDLSLDDIHCNFRVKGEWDLSLLETHSHVEPELKYNGHGWGKKQENSSKKDDEGLTVSRNLEESTDNTFQDAPSEPPADIINTEPKKKNKKDKTSNATINDTTPNSKEE